MRTRIVRLDARASDDERRRLLTELADARDAGCAPVLMLRPGSADDDLAWLRFFDGECLVHLDDEAAARAAGLSVLGTFGADQASIALGSDDLARLWPSSNVRGRGKLWVIVSALLVLATMVAGAVPAPYMISHVEPARPVSAVVTFTPAAAAEAGGTEIYFGTSADRPLTWLELPVAKLRSLFSPVMVQSIDGRTYDERHGQLNETDEQDRTMVHQAARFAAMRAAKVPLGTVSGSGAVVEFSPPGGDIARGEVIVAVGNAPVHTVEELYRELDRSEVGKRVPVSLRGGRDSYLFLRPMPQLRRGWQAVPVLGGYKQHYKFTTLDLTYAPESKLDFTIRGRNVVGTSYGLPIALEAYQALTGKDLVKGRHIVATGRINEAGEVEYVGVELKAVAASEAGADILLVPTEAWSLAHRFGPFPPDTQIVGVSTLQEAIEFLERPYARLQTADEAG